jgi:hypothetical protein
MASTDARPIPVKNANYRITFPIFDADGDLVTAAGSLDSEVSKDGGTFTDCTNEATEIATSSGMYFLDITSTEMNADTVAVIIKSTGGKTTPIVMYPQESGDIDVNVQSMDADVITNSVIANDAIGATEIANSAIDANTFAAGAIDAAAIANNAIDAATFAAGAINAAAIADGAIDAATFATNAITATVLSATAVTEIKDAIVTNTITVEADGQAHADLKEWLGVVPLALASQRPQVEVDAYDGTVDFNATQKASINTEADSALVDINLDHLMFTSALAADVANDSIIAQLASTTVTYADFDNTTDSLQAIRDNHPANFSVFTIDGVGKINITEGDIDAASFAANAITATVLSATAISEIGTEVNTQVQDVMNTDTHTLPGQEAPTATPTYEEAITYLYKAFRNKSTSTANTYQLFADNTTTVDQVAAISDTTGTFTKGEVASGP